MKKMIFNLSFKNKIPSIGYQNIPLLKNQILIDKSLKNYLPKIIWTSDKFSQQILKNISRSKLKLLILVQKIILQFKEKIILP